MQGLLLINLGTPEGSDAGEALGPTEAQVRVYLKEFLMDPWVLDIAYPLRLALVHGSILPKRPAASAAAYRKIWMDQGSPLLVHSEALASGVQAELGAGWAVRLGMRYGRPSLEAALKDLAKAGLERLVVFPLYPQYSTAATESSVRRVLKLAKRWLPGVPLRIVPAFYEEPAFINSFVNISGGVSDLETAEHVVFSFHGLPERQIKKTDPTGTHCLRTPGCCERITSTNQNCYRAQCFATARAIAGKLDLAPDRYTVSFQSRLGRTPWIKPHTDVVYRELASLGVRRLVVFCPTFVADCLETLEEVAIRGSEDFKKNGGEKLTLVPSLNASPLWVSAVAGLARRSLSHPGSVLGSSSGLHDSEAGHGG